MLRKKLKNMKLKTGGMKYYNMITDYSHNKISNNVIEEELDSKLSIHFSDKNFDIQPLVS